MWRGAAAMGRGAAAVALLGYLVAGAAAAEGTSAPLGEWFWVGWLPAAWPLGHPVISAAGWMGGWMGGWAGRRVVRARAQREGKAAQDAADFCVQGPQIHGVAGLVNLFGIESPGLTSALALGEAVLEAL